MHRRDFLRNSAIAGGLALVAPSQAVRLVAGNSDVFHPAPTFSVIPVVGDGHYIWTEPPKDETGYLQPRHYNLKIGIEIEGTGDAGSIRGTTVAPVEQPGQEIKASRIEVEGCEAALRQVDSEAGQLILAASSIGKGQVIAAAAHFELIVYKEYQAYAADKFPVEQKVPRDLAKVTLYDSPGIQTRREEVRKLAADLSAQLEHPWDKAKAFHAWVWENIKARVGDYTSVIAALRDRVGDCEERACVFIALCRAAGIPARQVWVPNHAWAEFWLAESEGQGHWIPAHTSCYSWFGWTGAHELILQKGDRVQVPEQRSPMRLLADWMQWQGARPRVVYKAELTPLPDKSGGDAGPGARRKDERGQWQLLRNHALDGYMRV